MADMNFFTDFEVLWGSTGTVEPVTQDQYKLGWAYIGALPPAVEQFNKQHQLSDEKVKWLFTQIKTYAAAHGIPINAATTDALGLSLAHALSAFITPPQFDNDSSPSTTAFVQRALGSLSNVSLAITTSTQITAVTAGGFVIFSGATQNQILTLPAIATVPVGTSFYILNTANTPVTIKGSAAEQISGVNVGVGATSGNTLILGVGDMIRLVNQATYWLEVMGVRARNVSGLGSASQTWQDVSASRLIQTAYTNTTGRAIAMKFCVQSTVAEGYYNIVVAGVEVASGTVPINAKKTLYAIVPAGAAYNVGKGGADTATNVTWSELR